MVEGVKRRRRDYSLTFKQALGQGLPVSDDKPSGLLQAQSDCRLAPHTRAAGGWLRASGSVMSTTVGTCKRHQLLKRQDGSGLKVGQDRLFRILAEHHLQGRPRWTHHKATHSFQCFYRHPNLLRRGWSWSLWCPRASVGRQHNLSASQERAV